MAVAHFPSGSVLTWSTFLDTANAGDVITSSDAIAPQVANTPLRNYASHRSLELGLHPTPHRRAMTHPASRQRRTATLREPAARLPAPSVARTARTTLA